MLHTQKLVLNIQCTYNMAGFIWLLILFLQLNWYGAQCGISETELFSVYPAKERHGWISGPRHCLVSGFRAVFAPRSPKTSEWTECRICIFISHFREKYVSVLNTTARVSRCKTRFSILNYTICKLCRLNLVRIFISLYVWMLQSFHHDKKKGSSAV